MTEYRTNEKYKHPLFASDPEQFANDRGLNLPEAVKARFKVEIEWATRVVLSYFENYTVDYDDVYQEAVNLVMTYAGFNSGWQSGLLIQLEKKTEGDEKRIHRILATTLRMNLAHIVGRIVERDNPVTFFDDLAPNAEPSYTFEDSTISRIDNDRIMRKNYPILCLNILDGYTQPEIAQMHNLSERTIRSRMAAEKARFIKAHKGESN